MYYRISKLLSGLALREHFRMIRICELAEDRNFGALKDETFQNIRLHCGLQRSAAQILFISHAHDGKSFQFRSSEASKNKTLGSDYP